MLARIECSRGGRKVALNDDGRPLCAAHSHCRCTPELPGALAAQTQHRQLYRTPSETHRFARRRRPDVDSFATNETARVSYEVLTTVSTGVEPNTRAQRQVPRIRCDQSLGYHASTRSTSTQTVRSCDVSCRRYNISLFHCEFFTQITFGRFHGVWSSSFSDGWS